jgi:Bacterial protein of unknown function (DUF885)
LDIESTPRFLKIQKSVKRLSEPHFVLHAIGLFAYVLILSLSLTSANLQAQEGRLNEAAKALHELFASEWDYRMEQHPTWASRLGDRRWNDRWEDRSLDAINKRHSRHIEVLAKLRVIDREALSPPDRLNYDLFLKDYENEVEGHQYRRYLLPLNQRGGVQTADELADGLRFETLKDYEDWLARLRALPAYIEQTMTLMREGVKQRMLLPKIVLERIPAQFDHQIVQRREVEPILQTVRSFFCRDFRRGSVTSCAGGGGCHPSGRCSRFSAVERLFYQGLSSCFAESGWHLAAASRRRHLQIRGTPAHDDQHDP